MIILWLVLCTGPVADGNCQAPIKLGGAATLASCLEVAAIHRSILGPAVNYELACRPEGMPLGGKRKEKSATLPAAS